MSIITPITRPSPLTSSMGPIKARPPLVLIVDDDRLMRRMLRQVMEHEGYQVVEAEHGGEGVQCFQQHHPDLVLLDAMMPIMDGFATCQALQRLPGGSQTPTLLITALDDAASVDRAFVAGATDYVTKPIHWAVLRQRVRRLLRARQAELAVRRVYEATAQERARLRAILEASRDGIVLLGSHGRIVDLNGAALRLLDLPDQPDVWRGQSLRAAMKQARGNQPAVAAALGELRRTKGEPNATLQGEYSWKMGATVHCLEYLSLPLMASDGQGRLIVLRDVSEERAAHRLREDLSRMLVHDLRNPLGATLTAADMLQELTGSNGDDTSTLARIIHNNTQRALGLVTNILDVTRLETGQMPLEIEPVALDTSIEAVIQAVSPLANRKALTLSATCPPSARYVKADAKLIERILCNIIDNALKFTPAGGTIRVQASASDTHVTVVVADSGPGLPGDLQSRLFQKFASGRITGSGTGLGLAFCKLAVEAMGGSIWAANRNGGGCTIHFTVPILK